MRDRSSAERRRLPWVKGDKDYVFATPQGRKSLADLFEGCTQLLVHPFMFHPDWQAACRSCSFDADRAEGALVPLEHHDEPMCGCLAHHSTG